MNNILITGVNFQNQGAYMMLVAAASEVRSRNLGSPVIDIRWGSSRQKRNEGLQTLVSVDELRMLRSGLLDYAPTHWRDRLPFLTFADINGVIDASGFAFGDQWSHARLDARANRFRSFADNDAPVVVLPQAFGPLEKTRRPAETVLDASRLVFARDPESFGYLSQLDSFTSDKVHMCSDFTIGLRGRRPRALSRDFKPGVVVVPNINIASRGQRSEYVAALATVVQDAQAQGQMVTGLVHDSGRDRELLAQLTNQGIDFPILDGMDGLESKWVLGAADAVVSGRFHATVSALSQGVPTVIHGWSHKYRHLAEDFSVPDLVASPYDSGQTLAVLHAALAGGDLQPRLQSAKETLLDGISGMWDKVEQSMAV